jgi:hypothetical protein
MNTSATQVPVCVTQGHSTIQGLLVEELANGIAIIQVGQVTHTGPLVKKK